MNQDVYKILYCSRNLIEGGQDEHDANLSQILATSRTNNSRDNVTGALLFNDGWFAQVLEGPQSAIESTFERIQRDTRHGDVIILESGNAGRRDFPEWSMAHVQPPTEAQSSHLTTALEQASIDPSSSGAEVLQLLRTLVIQED